MSPELPDPQAPDSPDHPDRTAPLPPSAEPTARPTRTQPDDSSSRRRLPVDRHQFDPMALIAGAIFMAIAVLYLADSGGSVHARPGMTLCLAVIGVGASGLAGALWAMFTGRRRKEADPAAASAAPVDLRK